MEQKNKTKALAITDPAYRQWIKEVESRFKRQQIKAAIHINTDKIEFYWTLGRDICDMQIERRYGESAIEILSKDLRQAMPEARGLTPVNLYYCKRLYLLYSQMFEKFPQVVEKSCSEQNKDALIQKVPKLGKYSSHCIQCN